MSPHLRKPFLLCILVLATFLPLCGSLLLWHGMPPGYGAFPPQRVEAPPGFNLYYFAAGCVVVAIMLAFLLFPRLFGFKQPAPPMPPTYGPFPFWFKPAVVVTLVSWALMWFGPALIARWTFVPLWWGFIYTLDGCVYALTNGKSLVSVRKHEMLILALVSVVGWYLFEYWNYFVLANWYYPYANLLTPFGNIVWYSLSYTTVWPVCFETFMLLMAIPAIRLRWADGPKLKLPTWLVAATLVVGLALQFGIGVFPYPLFWGLWIGSLLIFGCALTLAGCWTPFDPAAKGDWSRFILMAVATMLDGFVWEFWNFGSQAFRNGVPTNPNYWIYDIPYFNVGHFFSELPALGYFGYLFFGILVWAYWLMVAHLIDLDPDFAHDDVLGDPGDGGAQADQLRPDAA
jgi:hypothetical protein